MRRIHLTAAICIAACSMSLVACGGSEAPETTAATEAATEAAAEETSAEEETAEAAEESTAEETSEAAAEGTAELRIGQAYGAAHGNKCFTVATAVIDGDDTIVAAYIDEFQFFDEGQTGVPNSGSFIEKGYVAEGRVLGSKRANNAYYSENMAKAGATMELAANFDGLQAFAAGKTISELEELAGKPAEEVVDAVSSATLADTAGYIGVIADAAKAAEETPAVSYDGDLADLSLNMAVTVTHGEDSFALAAVYGDGNEIVLSYLDEFQFFDADQTGVPNSEAFAEAGDISADYVLGSKRVNDAFYSANMAKAGATMNIAANYDGIQAYVDGKTVAELEELLGGSDEEVIDAVSSATLTAMPAISAQCWKRQSKKRQ